MKTISTLFVMLALLVSSVTFAQTRKVIEPNVGFLNDLILADTTAAGEHEPTIYVLKRDATYLVAGTFQSRGFKLHIVAEDGNGALPIVSAYPDGEGTINSNLIRPYADAEFENIYFDGRQPDNEEQSLPGRIFRTEGEGMNLTVKNCILNNASQSAVRVNKAANKIEFVNCIVANIGDISADNLGNGRIVDARSSDIDHCILKNCTFVNTCDRIVRHRGGSGVLNKLEVDHCTIVNNMGFQGFFELGNVGTSIKLTNNLIYDGFTMGNDPSDAERLTEFDSHTGEGVDPYMVWVGAIPNDSTTFEISNNVYTISDDLEAFYTAKGIDEGPNNLLSDHIKTKVADATKAFVKAPVTLGNIPALMTELMEWYWAADGANKTKMTTGTFSMNRETAAYWISTLNCSYSASGDQYKGTDGKPVGDTNWNSTLVGVKDIQNDVLSIENYPNPFSIATTIKFNLHKKSAVNISVYDMVGKEVGQMNMGQFSQGVNSVRFNRNELNSGIYLLRIDAGDYSAVTRIVIR